MKSLELNCGQTSLTIAPWLGGGISAFEWHGHDIFRRHNGVNDPLELASFLMVPFCNRIANSTVAMSSAKRSFPLSHPIAEPVHALHGLGWISPWAVRNHSPDKAHLLLHHDGAIWPWAFHASQEFEVFEDGYQHKAALTNMADTPMPAGLGLHPYLPRDGAVLKLAVTGIWETGPERLPTSYRHLERPPKWLSDQAFDNCFASPDEVIEVSWPTHKLTIHPSANLAFTHIYSPDKQDFFCAEPVSHIPDAANSDLSADETGLLMLDPGQSMEIDCRFHVEETH